MANGDIVEDIRRGAQNLGRGSLLGRAVTGMADLGQSASEAYDRATAAAKPYLDRLTQTKQVQAATPPRPIASVKPKKKRPARLGRTQLGRPDAGR
jgi:hypothetical protein